MATKSKTPATPIEADKRFAKLQNHVATYPFQFGEFPTHISKRSLEEDRRKQGKFLRELKEAGYIPPHDDLQDECAVEINYAKVWDSIEPEEFDLFKSWQYDEDKRIDFVPIKRFSAGQIKQLLGTRGTMFVAASSAPIKWKGYQYADEPGFDPDRHHPWCEPCDTLNEAMANLRELKKRCRETKSYDSWSNEIFVTSEELSRQLEEHLFIEQLEELYPRNLLWGLIQLTPLTEDDLFYPLEEGQDRRKSRISVSLDDGIYFTPRGSTLSSKPADWEQNLQDSIDRHAKSIRESEAAIDLLFRVQDAVTNYGGWDKFLEDYRTALAAELKKEG